MTALRYTRSLAEPLCSLRFARDSALLSWHSVGLKKKVGGVDHLVYFVGWNSDGLARYNFLMSLQIYRQAVSCRHYSKG